MPQPSAELRATIIQYALENPGSSQQELRLIKSELERLQHLTKKTLPKLTHDMLVAYVEQAAPADIIDPDTIEQNLRKKISDEVITLDSYIPAEARQEIENNAPAYIQATPHVGFHVSYRSGTPYVTQYQPADVFSLPGEVYLPDGRHILFTGLHGKKLSIEKLRQELSELR